MDIEAQKQQEKRSSSWVCWGVVATVFGLCYWVGDCYIESGALRSHWNNTEQAKGVFDILSVLGWVSLTPLAAYYFICIGDPLQEVWRQLSHTALCLDKLCNSDTSYALLGRLGSPLTRASNWVRFTFSLSAVVCLACYILQFVIAVYRTIDNVDLISHPENFPELSAANPNQTMLKLLAVGRIGFYTLGVPLFLVASLHVQLCLHLSYSDMHEVRTARKVEQCRALLKPGQWLSAYFLVAMYFWSLAYAAYFVVPNGDWKDVCNWALPVAITSANLACGATYNYQLKTYPDALYSRDEVSDPPYYRILGWPVHGLYVLAEFCFKLVLPLLVFAFRY